MKKEKSKKNKKEQDYFDIAKEKEKSSEIMNKFHKARNFNNDRQDSYAELMAFYQGNQHLLKKYKKEVPWVVNMNTPYAAVAIDQRVASLLANDYIGELQPLSVDDVDTMEKLNSFYQKEWERMNVDNIVRLSIEKAAVVRESYCHIIYEKDKIIGGTNKKRQGTLKAYLIEPSCVYIDPDAREFRDARYVFVVGRISIEEACEKYPNLKEHLKSKASILTPNDRGEVYLDNDYDSQQDDVISVIHFYQKKNGRIKRYKLIKDIIVDEKEMKIKQIPIAQFRWKKAAQSCYGLSLMDEILTLQKAITSIESAITNTALAYAAPSMMVRKGCGVDPKAVSIAAGAPGVVYHVDGNLDNAIKPVIPPRLEANIVNMKTDFQEQIKSITGVSQQFLGNIGTSGNTSGGASTAVERATIIELKVLNNISQYVEDITNIIVEFITTVYAGETVNVPDGKSVEGQFQFKDIEIPVQKKLDSANYKYYIELDTKTPYSREKQKQLLMELFQFERQYDVPVKTITATDIIKNTDLENKDEIIARFTTLNSQSAQTKAETIAQLQSTAQNYQIPQELINQAVAEIISGVKETPAVQEVMKMMESGFQQKMQQNDTNLQNATNMLMNTTSGQQEVQQMADQMTAQMMNN